MVAKGSPLATLTEAGGGTQLRYTVEAQIGGKLARLGPRLISGTAKRPAAEFFAKFASMLKVDCKTAVSIGRLIAREIEGAGGVAS